MNKQTYGPKRLNEDYSIELNIYPNKKIMELYIYKNTNSNTKPRTIEEYIDVNFVNGSRGQFRPLSLDNKVLNLIKNEFDKLSNSLKDFVSRNCINTNKIRKIHIKTIER